MAAAAIASCHFFEDHAAPWRRNMQVYVATPGMRSKKHALISGFTLSSGSLLGAMQAGFTQILQTQNVLSMVHSFKVTQQ